MKINKPTNKFIRLYNKSFLGTRPAKEKKQTRSENIWAKACKGVEDSKSDNEIIKEILESEAGEKAKEKANPREWLQKEVDRARKHTEPKKIEIEIDFLNNFISGDALKITKFNPIRWVMKKILPEGLSLLAALPKFGKGWLMIDLCTAVATGKTAWGKKVKKGTAVYLALEDSQRRIQSRMKKAQLPFPKKFRLYTSWPRLNEGGLELLETLIDEVGDLRLIVIDTFQKVRKPASGQRQIYRADYEDSEKLQRLAIDKGICILLVHHLTKMTMDDPFLSISGSTGLTGVMDTLMVCNTDKEGNSNIHIKGREVEDQSFRLKRDGDRLIWTLGSFSTFTGNRKKVMAFIKDNPKTTVSKIAENLHMYQGSVTNCLKSPIQKGLLSIEIVGKEKQFTLNEKKDSFS